MLYVSCNELGKNAKTMNHNELINKVIDDFEKLGIELTSFGNVLIPGFYPDACGEFNGRSITVECKIVPNENIRAQILSVINQYRGCIEYIGDRGIVILVIGKSNDESLIYYNLTSLVHSNKTKIKRELDSLLKEDGKLLMNWFDDGKDSLVDIKIISQKKAEQDSERRYSYFQYATLFLAIASVVVFIVLDGIGMYKLFTERLIIIGILVALFVLPFVKKITFKDGSVEFKKAKDVDEKK